MSETQTRLSVAHNINGHVERTNYNRSFHSLRHVLCRVCKLQAFLYWGTICGRDISSDERENEGFVGNGSAMGRQYIDHSECLESHFEAVFLEQ